jgi:hypothetical protein
MIVLGVVVLGFGVYSVFAVEGSDVGFDYAEGTGPAIDVSNIGLWVRRICWMWVAFSGACSVFLGARLLSSLRRHAGNAA